MKEKRPALRAFTWIRPYIRGIKEGIYNKIKDLIIVG